MRDQVRHRETEFQCFGTELYLPFYLHCINFYCCYETETQAVILWAFVRTTYSCMHEQIAATSSSYSWLAIAGIVIVLAVFVLTLVQQQQHKRMTYLLRTFSKRFNISSVQSLEVSWFESPSKKRVAEFILVWRSSICIVRS